MNYFIAAATNRGNVKPTNQDSLSVQRLSTEQGKMVFAVLCDGMGGLQKGEVASATVIRAMTDWVEEQLKILSEHKIQMADVAEMWTRIVRNCNQRLRNYGAQQGIRLGTTIVAILLTADEYCILNVGDSRCYAIGNEVTLLTKDQTLVQREVDQGILTEEEAEVDKRRSVLLQCIGASENVYPDIYKGKTAPDTVYMLCSDGFRHEISEAEILQYLGPRSSESENKMTEALNQLIDLNMQRGERDNISALTIHTVNR